jgi:hypothetical protein
MYNFLKATLDSVNQLSPKPEEYFITTIKGTEHLPLAVVNSEGKQGVQFNLYNENGIYIGFKTFFFSTLISIEHYKSFPVKPESFLAKDTPTTLEQLVKGCVDRKSNGL